MAGGVQNIEQDRFAFSYNHRFLVIENGLHRRILANEIEIPDTVRLWRYDLNRTGSVWRNCYWTEVETAYPKLAGEATGIGDHQCVWRAEWRFPAAEAHDRVHTGERRFSQCGVFVEYTNNYEVPENDLIWTQMLSV